jgi:hypothetical protein
MAEVIFTHTFVPRDDAEPSQPAIIKIAKRATGTRSREIREFIGRNYESPNLTSGISDKMSGIPDIGKRISR